MQRACAILHCHLWPLWLHQIIRLCMINITIFRKKVLEHKMCILILPTTLSETCLIIRRINRYIVINVKTSLCKIPFVPVRSLGNLTFIIRFSKNWNTKFYQNPSSGSRVVSFGRTDRQIDRHDYDISRISQFIEGAKKYKRDVKFEFSKRQWFH